MIKRLFVQLTVCLLVSCNNNAAISHPVSDTIKGVPAKSDGVSYNLAKPDQTWTVPDGLKEISGISWLDAGHLMAIEDLHANLYVLKMDKTVVIEKTIPFQDDKDKKFDIEDVTLAGNSAYAIWSHGVVFEISNWNTKPVATEYTTALTKEDNPEGICLDPVSGNLLVACKGFNENSEEKKSTRAVYTFSTKLKKLAAAPLFFIRKKDFTAQGNPGVDFNPSAIAVDPIQHNLYILSTRGTKGMAVFSRDGKLISFQYLDPVLFPQPEGICFSPDGTLYISSEGKASAAVIYKFNKVNSNK